MDKMIMLNRYLIPDIR